MLILAVLRPLGYGMTVWLSAAAGWGAAVLLWPKITGKQRIQALAILAVGILFALAGFTRGAPVSLQQAFGQNQMILAMLAAVSFLKLTNRPTREGDAIPTGPGAFIRTLAGVHLFGAAINITALVIIADRLAAQAPFRHLQALSLSRGFCLSVMYSPFIAGMALALALSPGARLDIVALAGIPYAAVGLMLTAWHLSLAHGDEVAVFKGYPIHLESLWFPALLAVLVAIVHGMYPRLSILLLISFLAPVMVVIIVIHGDGRSAGVTRLTRHVETILPQMSGELLLFLSAGILAAGLTSLASSMGNPVPFDEFDWLAGSLTLTTIVALSIIGIHPIICVSFFAPLIIPLDPQPDLVALVFVMGWAIGCTVSPFSGTNLTMQGRYGISSWSITLGNLGYCALMVVVGWGFIYGFTRFV
ncbi:MAG: hypothetical protein DHS20C01_08960 [marine bacterium B5-7]|nr:MAG: hypothetical protein DHS20C01_08960 [marine bacterium B5-7]